MFRKSVDNDLLFVVAKLQNFVKYQAGFQVFVFYRMGGHFSRPPTSLATGFRTSIWLNFATSYLFSHHPQLLPGNKSYAPSITFIFS